MLFFTCGPVALIPVGILDGFILPYNMNFVGISRKFLWQVLPTAIGLVGFWMWVFLPHEDVSFVEVGLFLYAIVLRSLTIAIKYGYLSDEYIAMMKTKLVP